MNLLSVMLMILYPLSPALRTTTIFAAPSDDDDDSADATEADDDDDDFYFLADDDFSFHARGPPQPSLLVSPKPNGRRRTYCLRRDAPETAGACSLPSHPSFA